MKIFSLEKQMLFSTLLILVVFMAKVHGLGREPIANS
jgi:hypothetical protein